MFAMITSIILLMKLTIYCTVIANEDESINNRPYIKQCKHGMFLLHSNDNYVSRHLDIYGEWAEQELSLFLSLINETDIVIDAGANIGAFTIPLAKAVGPYGTVHSFEPQRIIYQRLNANIALNNLENVYTYLVALGNMDHMIKLPIVDYSIKQNFGRFSILDYDDNDIHLYHNISMRTLDSISFLNIYTGKDCPNLIKLDVEMMELYILQGSNQMISRCKPIIYTENNCIKTSFDLITQLYDLDYIPYWHLKSTYNYDAYNGIIDDFTNGYIDINMLCIHKSKLINYSNYIDENYRVVLDKPYLRQYNIYNPMKEEYIQQGGSLTSCID